MQPVIPQHKAMQTRMVKAVAMQAPKRKTCPKCKRTRAMKNFGVRTQHDAQGKPVRSLPQSYCKDCRKAA